MFNKIPTEICVNIFDYLGQRDLKSTKLVSKFWNSCAEDTIQGKRELATQMLYKNVLKGDVEGVLLALKKGANINVKINGSSSTYYFYNGNLLHSIIFKLAGFRNLFSPMRKNHELIFRILLENGIDSQHEAKIANYHEYEFDSKSESLAKADCLLSGDFDNDTLRALLILQNMELNLEAGKIKIEDIKTTLNLVGQLSAKTLFDYQHKLESHHLGLGYKYSAEEVAFIHDHVESINVEESKCSIS